MDNGEKCVMHSETDNIDTMINNEVGEVIEKLFESLKNRYQNNSMNQLKVVILSSIMLIYCIINAIK